MTDPDLRPLDRWLHSLLDEVLAIEEILEQIHDRYYFELHPGEDEVTSLSG